MELHVVIQGRKDLAEQLYTQLREAIESGRLAPGTQLPPSRLLAEQLGISRKTVSDTYATLTYDNLLIGKVGKGTFVNTHASRVEAHLQQVPLAAAASVNRWLDLELPFRHPQLEGTQRYEFIGGAISHNLFPQDDWRACTQHAVRQTAKERGFYSQPEGLPVLRDAIARYIAFARGVKCQVDNLIVCNGAQQALDLIARVLLQPGCTVAMEEPGYTPARLLFSMLGARVVGIPVDEEGMQVELIPDEAQLIYVTPSHQFPLGMPMSPVRREALLVRAHALGAIVVEDDYDCEFRYEGRPTDSLQSLDRYGVVAYVGTFSKTLSPELRLGYMVVPPAIHQALIKAKQLSDWHSSTLAQWALAKFINEGHLVRHVRRCHAVYAARRDRLIRRFADDLSPWFELVPATAGFHMAALCRVPMDVGLLIELARKVEVGLYALEHFFHDSAPRKGLLMGYGAIETLDIDLALDRVRDILREIA